MSDPGSGAARRAIYTIPLHRSFADSLAAGMIARFGTAPDALAAGRILLPNNRAVRTVTEAFVRASGSGLLLPRLIPIGDPDLDERIGGALDLVDLDNPLAAIDPLDRLLELASIVRPQVDGSAEALRLASELAATIDTLTVEGIDPTSLAAAADDSPDLAAHWSAALDRLRIALDAWPDRLRQLGKVDLAERRNRLLESVERRWRDRPPAGFTAAAGIGSAAPAVAALLSRVSQMPGGMVVLPGLALRATMNDEEWDALGPDDKGAGAPTHPQYHLKLLLDRMGVSREEVERWRSKGRSASPPARAKAIANAMAAAQYSGKWTDLRPAERRLSGVRVAELPDPASEALAIALALREALETPGRTAALVTPDRQLAKRVSALLRRWDIAADDSAGTPLSRMAAGTLLLGIAAVAAEDFAPVALLALLKHPLAGGEGEERRHWLDKVRSIDLALRGPRPSAGLAGLDAHFEAKDREKPFRGCLDDWRQLRGRVASLSGLSGGPISLSQFADAVAAAATALAGPRAWAGADGRAAARLLQDLIARAEDLALGREDLVPVLRQLVDDIPIRPPYGGHPRLFIWGLLEARLQQADLMVLGGLNEGVWPAAPTPDPWLAPKIRLNLGLPGLDQRIGLAAHDFAGALGAPQVLITRARRDERAPTVASRFWLRLQAMTGGLPRDVRLERLAAILDNPDHVRPAAKPLVNPPLSARPVRISVTDVDRLKADPYAFYAKAILKLRREEPVDADHTAAWKGVAVHECLNQWMEEDGCDPSKLRARAELLLADSTIHPMLRALWRPRLLEAIDFVAGQESDNRSEGRAPLVAEIFGEAAIAGVTVYGKVDRIDRNADGTLAILDYKTGKAPAQKQVDSGFALQLGLLGLIAEAGGFDGIAGIPSAHEYWSFAKNKDAYGRVVRPDRKIGPAQFLEQSKAHFEEAAARWLTGQNPFPPKLQPAYARDDYDQLMRLEEWYGRS